jgi:tetratricopeptide (TPR) repeat protein
MKKRAFLFLAASSVLLAVVCNMAACRQTAPKTAEDYQTRGLKHLNNGEYDMAIADYEAALRIDPNNIFPAQRRQFHSQKQVWVI